MSKLSLIGFDGIDGSGKTSLIRSLMRDRILENKAIFTTRRDPYSPYVEEMYSVIHTFKDSFDALNLFVMDLQYRYSRMPFNRIILSDRTFMSAVVFYDSISALSRVRDKALCGRIKSLSQKYQPCLSVVLLVDVDEARRRIYRERKSFTAVEEVPFMSLCASRFAEIESSGNVLVVDTNHTNMVDTYNIIRERILALGLDPLR